MARQRPLCVVVGVRDYTVRRGKSRGTERDALIRRGQPPLSGVRARRVTRHNAPPYRLIAAPAHLGTWASGYAAVAYYTIKVFFFFLNVTKSSATTYSKNLFSLCIHTINQRRFAYIIRQTTKINRNEFRVVVVEHRRRVKCTTYFRNIL